MSECTLLKVFCFLGVYLITALVLALFCSSSWLYSSTILWVRVDS